MSTYRSLTEAGSLTISHMYDIQIDQLSNVDMLAVSNIDSLLLIGSRLSKSYFIYNSSGSFVKSQKVQDEDEMAVDEEEDIVYEQQVDEQKSKEKLVDLAWTPRGNIICLTDSSYVLTISRVTGKVMTLPEQAGTDARSISTSPLLYIADYDTGTFYSFDDGESWWNNVDIPELHVKFAQAIPVTSKQQMKTNTNTLVWWVATEINHDMPSESYQLIIYKIHNYTDSYSRNRVSTLITITQPSAVVFNIQSNFKRMAYDGRSTMFIVCNHISDVYLFSISGVYDRQLTFLPRLSLNSYPLCLAFDKHNQVMFIGHSQIGLVRVFRLAY